MATILVVDDQPRARDLLGAELEDAGFDVLTAEDGDAGWETFCRQDPAVVITDMSMPRCDGIELLRRIRSRSDVPVIVFSGHGSVQSAAEAFKAGADDFVNSLDLEIDDLVRLVREAAQSKPSPPSGADLEQHLVGSSPAMSRVRWQVHGLAPLLTPVLVSGEVGTGRGRAVRAMHELGATSRGPLHRFDAAQFQPSDLREDGVLQAVHLSEVHALDPGLQKFWADRLQRDQSSQLPLQIRLFASSSEPLAPLIRQGLFEPRLGQALLRFEVKMPGLADRPEDLPDITRVMLEKIGSAVGRERITLSPAALKYLQGCRFSENLRQIEALLERAVGYTLGKVIRRQILHDLVIDMKKSVASIRDDRQRIERDRLLQTLRDCGGNISQTAEILNKSRSAIYRLIAKHDIPLNRGR